MSDPVGIMKEVAARVVGGFGFTKKGIVQTYDGLRYMAQVMLVPEEIVTGYLPIGTMGVGDSYGMTYGLEVGQEVTVYFENGDLDGAMIGPRMYASEVPVPTKPGEFKIRHKSGSFLKMFDDGTVELSAAKDLFLKGDQRVIISTPGRFITNAHETQGFTDTSVPGGGFNSALDVDKTDDL